ncbi:MAG: hypothetical protein IH594_07620 [Bacteroidales bacterium]|nr:hypothetical protein [Bacteroidales bacterium]
MEEYEKYTDEMREKSNFDLQELVRNYQNEDKMLVIAALRELERRDVLYPEDRKLLEDLEDETKTPARFEKDVPPVTPFSLFRDPDIVDDFKAPKLYSRYAIRFFAIIFSTLFGGILLAINFNRLGKKREIAFVVIFSLLYSILVYRVTVIKPENAATITLIMNLLGSLILEEFFWKRFIGRHFKFRKQAITGALMVGFGLSLILILVMAGGMG